MSDQIQRSVEFLAVVIENVEPRQTLAETQDRCVELAVDGLPPFGGPVCWVRITAADCRVPVRSFGLVDPITSIRR